MLVTQKKFKEIVHNFKTGNTYNKVETDEKFSSYDVEKKWEKQTRAFAEKEKSEIAQAKALEQAARLRAIEAQEKAEEEAAAAKKAQQAAYVPETPRFTYEDIEYAWRVGERNFFGSDELTQEDIDNLQDIWEYAQRSISTEHVFRSFMSTCMNRKQYWQFFNGTR